MRAICEQVVARPSYATDLIGLRCARGGLELGLLHTANLVLALDCKGYTAGSNEQASDLKMLS